MNDKKFRVNYFYWKACRIHNQIIETKGIENEDETINFWKEIEEEVKNGEIIIIQCNGKTRMGKSTVGWVLAKIIWQLLIKHKKRQSKDEFNIDYIMRDQQELSKSIRNPNIGNCVVLVDENNELEQGGENVTAEQQLLQNFSNVQAARYIHRIWCSPSDIQDPNADIILEAVAKEKGITHCKLYYRLNKPEASYPVLLGYINIDVNEIIKNWEEKIKDIFYKQTKTKEDKEIIKKEAKKDEYVKYQIEKHAKMELITKEGIFRPRMLDYANIILEVVERLEPLAMRNGTITQHLIKGHIKIKSRKEKLILSLIGEKLMTDEAFGILKLVEEYYKTQRAFKKTKDPQEQKLLKETEIEMKNTITEMIEELKNYARIKKEYQKKREWND